jgi:hypothetical protein
VDNHEDAYESPDDDLHSFTTIICEHCGHQIKVPVYCGNRFCPICSRPRLARVRRRLQFLIKNTEKLNGYSFKHLTLTIRSETDLPNMLRNLSRSFRRLRQRSFWKFHVSGGAFVFEVTKKEGYWHAHIHCIMYARFIDWSTLLRLWQSVSKGRGVYIQRIPEYQIVRYLTKYISKPAGSGASSEDVEFSLAGFRLFNPFGSWYNLSIKFVDEKPGCPMCGSRSLLPLDIFYRMNDKTSWIHAPM